MESRQNEVKQGKTMWIKEIDHEVGICGYGCPSCGFFMVSLDAPNKCPMCGEIHTGWVYAEELAAKGVSI